MYKIIVCDLDETLISRDRTISSENIEAIRKATEAGVKFVPCTGRGYNSVHNTTSQLGLFDQKDQYVISYNGGAITENKDEKQLYFQGITFEEAEAIYKRGLTYDHICIHIYTPDQVWVRNFYPEEVEYLANRQPCTEIFSDDIDFLKGKEIVKAIYMNTDSIAIGDNFNDLSMIQAAGLGVGVSNTIADMKPLCDVITENDCDHSAVAEVINRYVLKQ